MSMQIERAEVQYLRNLRRIYEEGVDLKNERTGEVCRTLIGLDMTYDATSNRAPIITTRKYNASVAISELLGYLKGYTSAAQFRELGNRTWDSNANENTAWLNNPNRKGTDDMGLVYGAVARNWPVVDQNSSAPAGHYLVSDKSINLIRKVYDNLRAGKDDRGEIISFWNPGMFHLGCLRPCMYEHQFSLLGDDLYLNSTQRSWDGPLGGAANMVQAWVLLRLMAQITQKNPKFAQHRIVNGHIYGSQLDLVPTQLEREPLAEPTIEINPDIETLDDVETWVTVSDFEVTYPEYHGPIKYPFAV